MQYTESANSSIGNLYSLCMYPQCCIVGPTTQQSASDVTMLTNYVTLQKGKCLYHVYIDIF